MDQVYLRNTNIQLQDLNNDSVYIITHIKDGSKDISQCEHHTYKQLNRTDVLRIIDKYQEDYKGNYMLIFEQGNYITVKQYFELNNYNTDNCFEIK